MKTIYLLFVFSLILIGTVVISCNEKKPSLLENEYIMKIAFFPQGLLDETYYFILTEKKELNAQIGVRKNNDIRTVPFLTKIDSEKQIKISEENVLQLKQIAKELYENYDYVKEGIFNVDDAWFISVYFRDKIMIKQAYDNEMKKLQEKIIELAPIEIDLRGFS